MRKINIPLDGMSAENIFNVCLNAYEKKYIRDDLLKLTDKVITAANDYKKYIPYDFDAFVHSKCDEDEKHKMIKLYEYIFVKKRVGGFYDSIISNAHHICPFCGEGVPTTLDHFLPKSEFPFLAVFPCNLVPSCRDCNMEKKSFTPKDNKELPLHPYYDEIDCIWLEVKFDFSHKDYIDFEYYNGYDAAKDSILSNRIEAHIEIHGLRSKFETHATSFINSQKRNHLRIAELSVDDLREELSSVLVSFELEDKNSWRSALHRGLLSNLEEYYEWLKRALEVG